MLPFFVVPKRPADFESTAGTRTNPTAEAVKKKLELEEQLADSAVLADQILDESFAPADSLVMSCQDVP